VGFLAQFSPDWLDVGVTFVTLGVAYFIFGIAGFGSALIAAPVLAHKLPLTSIVPLLALLDLVAALINGVKLRTDLARSELFSLVPLMVIGSVAGAILLVSLPPQLMILALGLFVAGYGTYGLLARPREGKLAWAWVFPFGLVGGLFSGMFGSGGFIYSIYLSRRLTEKNAIRATQSTLIGLATLTRVIIFSIAGVYQDYKLLLLALAGVPALLLGIYVGHRVTLHLSLQQFVRILHVILIATGCSLILRAVTG
jgi:uncharacterized protein